MLISNKAPTMSVYLADRKTFKNFIVKPYEVALDLNFGSLSKVTFKINKKIYDTDTCEWVDNPSYDSIQENDIVHMPTGISRYKFKAQETADSEYIVNAEHQTYRNVTASGLGFNAKIDKVILQKETELFDIGGESGYAWKNFYKIENGSYMKSNDGKDMACESYFPVEVGDIISMGCKTNNSGHFSSDGTDRFYYKLHFSESDSKTSNEDITSLSSNWYSFDPVGRVRVTNSMLPNGKGYVRFSGRLRSDFIPYDGWVKIYSGERRCTEIECRDSGIKTTKPERWWVICDIEENNDYINSTKTVTLYSYEYVLSQKLFSISEATLPLYVPDVIVNTVKSDKFLIDATTKKDGTKICYSGAQRMERGLINQILDYLPDWKIGYVSTNVLTRYRTIEEINNSSIYSCLFDKISNLYQCFILCDNEDRKINLIDKDDVLEVSSPLTLSWRNALKSIKINNTENKYITAMRVNTADNTYGLGLVNPNGSGYIYNFNYIKDNLDYVVDEKHLKLDESTPYTLKEVIEMYDKSLAEVLEGKVKWGYTDTYKVYVQNFLDNTLKETKQATKLSELLVEYRSVADTINVFLYDDCYPNETDYNKWYVSDTPRTSSQMTNGGAYAPIDNLYTNYHSKELYNKLLSLAENYEKCKTKLNTITNKIKSSKAVLKFYANKYTMNYYTCKKIYDYDKPSWAANNPIFTPSELKALNAYTIEGDWTDSNAVFSEKFNTEDIIGTLTDVYNNSKRELDRIYSKPIYEFSVEIANIFGVPEMKEVLEDTYLGNTVYIAKDKRWITPVLLSVHYEYGNPESSTMTFSEDYTRKPKELRFSELFGKIDSVSVTNPTYTFAE